MSYACRQTTHHFILAMKSKTRAADELRSHIFELDIRLPEGKWVQFRCKEEVDRFT